MNLGNKESNYMFKNLFLFSAILLWTNGLAQDKRCAHDAFSHIMEKEIPGYLQNLEESRVHRFVSEPQMRNNFNSDTIPVVFHILYKTNAQNIPDARVHEQIAIMNQDYRALNADSVDIPNVFKSAKGYSKIHFALADRDPNGNYTTGINRYSTTVDEFIVDNKMKKTSTGGANAWDTKKYMNIWVCRIGDNTLGFATQPPAHGSPNDGMVLHYRHVGFSSGAPFNLGRTGVHETGHYLGLDHTWGGGGCTSDDGFSDTPAQASETYGVPSSIPQSCGSNDMYVNFMDYSDDKVLLMFTKQQVTYMHNILNTTRKSLLTSGGYVGVHEVKYPKATVYPNPVNHTLNIELQDIYLDQSIQITDISGKIVGNISVNKNHISYPIGSMENGIYFLLFRGQMINKFVVMK
ncbi:MAG: M43 family zinc metalloprotease [Flavobacteriales bacterium]|jgi:hypothetical protein|nr:M43 family zinc metalloprotease [Flavobacteriales bacterium]